MHAFWAKGQGAQSASRWALACNPSIEAEELLNVIILLGGMLNAIAKSVSLARKKSLPVYGKIQPTGSSPGFRADEVPATAAKGDTAQRGEGDGLLDRQPMRPLESDADRCLLRKTKLADEGLNIEGHSILNKEVPFRSQAAHRQFPKSNAKSEGKAAISLAGA